MASERNLPTCWQCLHCQQMLSNPEQMHKHIANTGHNFDTLSEDKKEHFYGYQGPGENTVK